VALNTFSDLVQEARERVKQDAIAAGLPDDGQGLEAGGRGAVAYAEGIASAMALAVDKAADYWSTICFWHNGAAHQKIVNTFSRQAIPMTWDFAEGNPFSSSSGHFLRFVSLIAEVLDTSVPAAPTGYARQQDAASSRPTETVVVSTDPPYFDNIGYADLSDFFFVWLRRSLRSVFPSLFATLASPKNEELVAAPYRHGGTEQAEAFFLAGMRKALECVRFQARPGLPVTIYYAFRQSERQGDGIASSTGWETFLTAVMQAGFSITGTWPVRTEYTGNLKKNVSALASSIVLVCRPRPTNAPSATRREFVNQLKAELPEALRHLQHGNIAPVDLAQAAIGPGMAIYTRYSKVVDAAGQPLSVREALALINEVLGEVLAEQEGDFDADTRWAVAWFEQFGFEEGEYGVAETLSKAKNTSVSGMVDAGILASRAGKVRLLTPAELPADWDPSTDTRLTVWEIVHHLIRVLEAEGEAGAANLVAKLGSKADVARELAYRLYTICERKKRAKEALSYNALVQSWPEIVRLAQVRSPAGTELEQTALFD